MGVYFKLAFHSCRWAYLGSEISLNKRPCKTFGVIQEHILKEVSRSGYFCCRKKKLYTQLRGGRRRRNSGIKKHTTQYGFILIVKLPVALTSKGFLVVFFKRFPAKKHSLMNIESVVSPTWLLHVLTARENTWSCLLNKTFTVQF